MKDEKLVTNDHYYYLGAFSLVSFFFIQLTSTNPLALSSRQPLYSEAVCKYMCTWDYLVKASPTLSHQKMLCEAPTAGQEEWDQ